MPRKHGESSEEIQLRETLGARGDFPPGIWGMFDIEGVIPLDSNGTGRGRGTRALDMWYTTPEGGAVFLGHKRRSSGDLVLGTGAESHWLPLLINVTNPSFVWPILSTHQGRWEIVDVAEVLRYVDVDLLWATLGVKYPRGCAPLARLSWGSVVPTTSEDGYGHEGARVTDQCRRFVPAGVDERGEPTPPGWQYASLKISTSRLRRDVPQAIAGEGEYESIQELAAAVRSVLG